MREEIVITRHGRPAGVLIGFESEDDWFDYRIENHPDFLRQIAEARSFLQRGLGIRLEDLDPGQPKAFPPPSRRPRPRYIAIERRGDGRQFEAQERGNGQRVVFYNRSGYCNRMSVVELIKQLKALPARERERVFLAILALDQDSPAPRATKRVKWPDIERRAKRIFGGRVLPNLVLLEREENPF